MSAAATIAAINEARQREWYEARDAYVAAMDNAQDHPHDDQRCRELTAARERYLAATDAAAAALNAVRDASGRAARRFLTDHARPTTS